MGHRAGMQTCGYETGDVRHVHQQIGANATGNLTDAGEVDNA